MIAKLEGYPVETRFTLRWRLGVKLGLAAAAIVAAVLAAATLAGFAQLRLAASATVWREVGRPLQTIVGRLEARHEQIALLLAPQARGDSFVAREAVRAAARDVLAGLQILERAGGDTRVAELDAELALLTRELQELEREAEAALSGGSARAAQQRVADVAEHVGRLRRGVEAIPGADGDALSGLLVVLAAAVAALALVVGVPLLMVVAVRAGGRARRLARAVDAMTFHIRAGDPPPLPEGPRTSDEIGYLAYTLGALVQSLRDSVLQAQQLASELDEAAGHDALTGALSRQRFLQVLDAELLRSRRYKGALSLMIFNVDSLAALNEKYGSEQGDYVLSTIAELVRFNVRKTDHFVRWSGGEFALLLTETALAGGRQLADKLRRNIELHPFDRVGRVTVSVGLTQFVEDDTRDSYVERADEAMRRAKARGRNRVVAAAVQPPGAAT
jgi:diguanylate cyclase (GGDEF)-like protein